MESVLFDPGYSDCLLGFSDNIEFMYSIFEGQIMPMKQKKFQFSMILPKIKTTVNQNISFYLGCLLWAVYIKNKKGAVIENNPCLGEKYDEKTSNEEVDYLYQFITEKLPKDTKFFLNKDYITDNNQIQILKTYKEFLKLNKGFIQTKTTDDIILPSNIKKTNEKNSEEIKAVIDDAIKQKDLTILMNAYSIILD